MASDEVEKMNITVNGVEYAPIKKDTLGVRIVILQRGWVMVGRYERDGNDCKLHNAQVIRIWGTTRGLGEIALNGPTGETVLDPCNGVVEFHRLTEIANIACCEGQWTKVLA